MKRTTRIALLFLTLLVLAATGAYAQDTTPAPAPPPVAAGLGVFGAAALLATFVEGTVEYLFRKNEKVAPYILYIALVFGIAIALAFKIDVLAALGVATPFPLAGYVVSGVIMGRGSNYFNDLITRIRNPVGATAAIKNTAGAS